MNRCETCSEIVRSGHVDFHTDAATGLSTLRYVVRYMAIPEKDRATSLPLILRLDVPVPSDISDCDPRKKEYERTLFDFAVSGIHDKHEKKWIFQQAAYPEEIDDEGHPLIPFPPEWIENYNRKLATLASGRNGTFFIIPIRELIGRPKYQGPDVVEVGLGSMP